MSKKLRIAVISGTTRKGNQSQKAARFIEHVGSSRDDIDVQLLDLQTFSFPHDGMGEGASDPKFTQSVREADAFVIVVPEYNHSFPGSLKRALDSVETKYYIHKPVAIAGISAGMWGGTRVIEHIVPVLRELGMMVTFADLQFPKVQDLFEEDGSPKDKKYIERVQRSYTELIWVAQGMKYAIENLPNTYHEPSDKK